MVKISETKVQKYGTRGKAITLPHIFATDNNITKGDTLTVYRDTLAINGTKTDCIIIVSENNKK